MGGPEMAPHTQTLGAPRRSRGTPRYSDRLLAGVEVVDVLDELADLQRLRDVVSEIEMLARGLESVDGHDPLFDEHHGERVHLGGELLDHVGVPATDAR